MIPKEFDYVAPTTLEEALSALRDGGEDAKLLAGGHSLIPMMKLRLAAPSLLVDLRNIAGLRNTSTSRNGTQVIGAMTTYQGLQEGGGLLAECAASVGDVQVRARGTIGGSLAHADPASDLPAAMLALDATLIASGLNGNGGSTVSEREIPAREFFLDLFTTALDPGEILTGVRVPDLGLSLGGATGGAYVKIRNKASHYALVGVAAAVGLDGDGACSHLAIGITGAASKPFRLESVENALKGTRLGDDDMRNAVSKAGEADVDWMSDLFGSEEYRKHLTGVVVARAIEMAKSRV